MFSSHLVEASRMVLMLLAMLVLSLSGISAILQSLILCWCRVSTKSVRAHSYWSILPILSSYWSILSVSDGALVLSTNNIIRTNKICDNPIPHFVITPSHTPVLLITNDKKLSSNMPRLLLSKNTKDFKSCLSKGFLKAWTHILLRLKSCFTLLCALR